MSPATFKDKDYSRILNTLSFKKEKAMKFEHMITIQPGHAFRCDGCVGGEDVNLLGEAVHHHTDGIVPLRFRQLSNQVDADDLPGLSWDVVRVKRVVRALPDGFDPLALSTPFDVFPDVPVDPWPPVVASDQLMGLVPSRVPCQGGVVVESNDFLPERGILGHIDAILPCDHPILVCPL